MSTTPGGGPESLQKTHRERERATTSLEFTLLHYSTNQSESDPIRSSLRREIFIIQADPTGVVVVLLGSFTAMRTERRKIRFKRVSFGKEGGKTNAKQKHGRDNRRP